MAAAGPVSLTDYLLEVHNSNPSLAASKLRVISLKHRIKPSSALDDPFIAAGIDERPFDGSKGEVRRYQISQKIPFPGKNRARKEIAKKRVEVSEFDALTRSRQIEVIATQVYLQAGYNKEAIRLNGRIQKIIEDTTASAKVRYKTGDSTHHEWLLAKLELATLKVEALRLERVRKTILAFLNELRNLPPETPLDVDHEWPTKNNVSITKVNSVLENQPELRSQQAQKELMSDELKLVKLSYAPDFVIQGMAMEPTMRNSEMKANWGLMVGVTIPLFFWRKQSELVKAAENERLANIAEYHSLQNRLNTELAEAKEQLRSSLDVVKLYKHDVIPLTDIAVKNAHAGYAARTLPLGQWLEALKSQKTQQLELIAAQYDVFVAKTRIEELLSNSPVTRFAPIRPTLFGSGMGQIGGLGMDVSPTINMGQGMSGPTRETSSPGESTSSGGMRGM